MSRRVVLIGGVVAAVAAVAAVVIFVLPSGSASASAATVDHVADRADRGSEKVLAQRDWGDGSLVLVGYARRGVRRLGLAFASKGLRGWKVGSYTEEPVEPDDVVVGSLLVASSAGGGGQPAWSAAVGELIDARIDRVEVKWSSGEKTIAPRTGSAYLVVQKGTTKAVEARYLADDGAEVAKVPVSGS
jgi:hypothetical protein